MTWDLDRERRWQSLNERRGETYAMRDRWINMNRSRQQRHTADHYHAHPGFREARHSLSSFRCNHINALHNNNILRTESAAHPSSRTLPSLDDHAYSAPSSGKSPRKDCPIPYHTAITMPPHKTAKVKFNALNRNSVCRLPHVHDVPHFPGFETRDVTEWKNEIKKVVPSRPKIFLPATLQPRSLTEMLASEVEQSRDPGTFFRPVSNTDKSSRGKEYMIHQEWPSERMSPRSARFRSRTDNVVSQISPGPTPFRPV